MNQFNFNSHPELNDHDFAAAAINIFNGKPGNAKSASDAEAAIQGFGGGAAGRYRLLFDPQGGWIAQGYRGNADDDWFKNVPSWAWVVITPACIITGAYLLWRAYGHLLKKATSESGSNNGGY